MLSLDPACWPAKGRTGPPWRSHGNRGGDFNGWAHGRARVFLATHSPVVFAGTEVEGNRRCSPIVCPRELVDAPERWYSDCATAALMGTDTWDLLVGNYFRDGAHVLDAKAGGTEVLHEGKSTDGGYKHSSWQGAEERRSPESDTVKFVGVPEEVARGWTVAIGACDLDGDLLPEIYFRQRLWSGSPVAQLVDPRPVFAILEGTGVGDAKSCVLGRDPSKGMGCDFLISMATAFQIYM